MSASNLIDFNERIRQLLAEQRWQPRWPGDQGRPQREVFPTRCQQFDEIANSLIVQVVQPRLEQDRLHLALDRLDEAQAGRWVEILIVEFLDVYLQLERRQNDAEESA